MKNIYYQTKSEYVYQWIKEAILDGSLLPEARLVIASIAKELNVSEIPVRDAIAKLSSEGLVDMGMHNRASVAGVSIQDFKDILEMRLILEPLSAKMATPYIEQDTIDRLQEQVDLMDECLESGDYSSFSEANRTFHTLIDNCCPNMLMVQMIADLTLKSSRVRAVFNIEHDRGRESNREHQQIVDAIRQRDEEAVYQIMHRQKKISFDLFMKAFSEMGKGKN